MQETNSIAAESVTSPLCERSVVIDGARMRYSNTGSGPDLLLLHGLLGYSFSWRFTLPALRNVASMHAVDMLGTGFSERPPDLDCSLQASARRLLRFADAVNLGPFDLLGTSHGGAVAMMAAALAPQRIRRLILVAPVNPWSAHGQRLSRILTRNPLAFALRRLSPWLSFSHERILRRLYGDPRRIAPGTLEGYSAAYRKPGALEYGLKVLGAWNQDLKHLESALPQIAAIQTLLIWGSADRAVAPESCEPLRRCFRDCTVKIFPGVGHLPYEEVPNEFNQVLREFLCGRTVE